MTITLTDEQWDLLCLTLGIANGCCLKKGERDLAQKIHKLFVAIQQSVTDEKPKTERQ